MVPILIAMASNLLGLNCDRVLTHHLLRGVDGFPVALKSKGLEELFGPSRQAPRRTTEVEGSFLPLSLHVCHSVARNRFGFLRTTVDGPNIQTHVSITVANP